jgi:hypothetical protein
MPNKPNIGRIQKNTFIFGGRKNERTIQKIDFVPVNLYALAVDGILP